MKIITLFLFASCAMAPSFTPKTKEGVACKKECALNLQECRGSSYTCDKGYAKCLESCIDLERLSN